MTVSMSHELKQAIAEHPGEPLELVDDASQARYVLLPRAEFDRVRALLSAEDFRLSDTYQAQCEALAKAGWDDPELDVYNDYDSQLP